jgi:hypothetical protein
MINEKTDIKTETKDITAGSLKVLFLKIDKKYFLTKK